MPHYRALVDSFVAQVLSIEIHDEKIKEVKAFFQQTPFKYSSIDDKNLTEALKDVGLLAGDLQDVFMQGLRSQASNSTWSWWLSAKDSLDRSRADRVVLDRVGGILAEAAIAFPVEERWRGAQDELADIIRLSNGNERLDELLQAADKVEGGIRVGVDVLPHLEALSAACVKSAGLEMPESKKVHIRGVFKAMLAEMERVVEMEDGLTKSLWDTMAALQKFQADVTTSENMKHCSEVLQLTQSLRDWPVQEQGRQVAWAVENQKKLAEIMRCHEKCKDMGVAGAWAAGTIQTCVARGASIISDARSSWTEEAKESVMSAFEALKAVAGGCDGGAPWNQKLNPTATWAEMLQHAAPLRIVDHMAGIRDKLHQMLEVALSESRNKENLHSLK